MSFNFKWPTFSEEFHKSAAQMLDSALNRGPKPKVIADDIRVEELGMGTIPPELEILEIGDLGTDRFRGIFRLTYAGDAHLVLKTKVQANPLTKPNRPDIGLFPSSTASRGILFAAAPLIVPMHLRLSSVKLRAIVVLVVSKAKGITLVFKNDPLESVEVSSTFDSVAVIQKYLQQEIEGQLREMFREDLPGIIHRLSQKWLSGEVKHEKEQAKQRAEGEVDQSSHPRTRETSLSRSTSESYPSFETASAPGGSPKRSRSKGRRSIGSSASVAGPTRSPPHSPPKVRAHLGRPRHVAKAASTSAVPLHNETSFSIHSAFSSSFPDIENYDPTYGLRPDDLPMHSGFSGLGKLAQRVSAGLKDLTEPPSVPDAQGDAGTLDVDDVDDVHGPELEQDPNFEHYDVDSDVTDHDLDAEDRSMLNQHRGLDATYSESDDNANEDVDDVSDLEDLLAMEDSSMDYSRFGYPPASAAFSDAHELNRASSIIFDDEPALPSRRIKRSHSSAKPLSELTRASSTRSVRSATSSTRRRKQSEVVYETIPAVGGGTVTRPRVYHIASKVQPPEVDWDDEDTARPSQYGGTPSTRTGATRFGSDFGSATQGARSSRTNTVRGINDSPHLDALHGRDDSEESLMELPPESLHSSDQSHDRNSHGRHGVSRPASVSHSSSFSAVRAGSTRLSSALSSSQDPSGRDTAYDPSGSSTAPTSAQSQAWASRSDSLAGGQFGATRGSSEASMDTNASGLKFRKNKSANHTRSKTNGAIDRAGFVAQSYGSGPGASATPARPRLAGIRPGFATSATSPPTDSGSWRRSPTLDSSVKDAGISSSPLAAQDMLSTSPFRDSSLHHGSPRGLSGSSGPFSSINNSPNAAGIVRATNNSSGNHHHQTANNAPTHLSIDASAHFLDLVKSNHTLSPFTRNMEHFTVRSAPVTPGWQTMSGTNSAVGSSAASGTGSGSSHHGAVARVSSTKKDKAIRPMSSSHSRTSSYTSAQASGVAGSGGPSEPNANSPARRRRTFQLGASSSSTLVQSPSKIDGGLAPSPVPANSDNLSPSRPGYGFASYAGSGPAPFYPPSTSVSSSSGASGKGIQSGAKELRRRSRPDSMGPPSEAARMSALRWEAIRE